MNYLLREDFLEKMLSSNLKVRIDMLARKRGTFEASQHADSRQDSCRTERGDTEIMQNWQARHRDHYRLLTQGTAQRRWPLRRLVWLLWKSIAWYKEHTLGKPENTGLTTSLYHSLTILLLHFLNFSCSSNEEKIIPTSLKVFSQWHRKINAKFLGHDNTQ